MEPQSRKVTIKLSKASADWYRSRNAYSDKQRADAMGMTLRRYLELWEFMKSVSGEWVTVSTCQQFLFGKNGGHRSSRRQTRRMLYALAATGLVECRYGLQSFHSETMVRLKPQ